MKKITIISIEGLISFLLLFTLSESYSQTKLTGHQYTMSSDSYIAFKYTREFQQEGDSYKTVYKIFHPTKGYHAFTMTATHLKSEKMVTVEIKNTGGGIWTHINSEKTTYETPSLETFGFRGAMGALGGNRVPNQLTVKFISNKYDYVKVMNVNSTQSGDNSDFYFYVFNEKN